MEQRFDAPPPAPERNRGEGHRQRAKRSRPPNLESSLANFLVQSWAWGDISPQLMHKCALHALIDVEAALRRQQDHRHQAIDPEFADLTNLKNLGGGGIYSNNMHAQLLRKLSPTRMPPLGAMELPIRANSVAGFQLKPTKVLHPHQLSKAIRDNYPRAFVKRLCPGTAALQKFWDIQDGNPQFANHPMKQVADWKTKAIPITLHGDGLPVVGVGKPSTKSLELLSLCSLFGTRSTVQFNFYSFSIFKDSCSSKFGGNTFAKVWRTFAWSLSWLH